MPVVPKGQHLEDPGWWTLVDVGLLGHTFHFCVCSVGGFHQDSGSMPVLTASNKDCPTEEMKCSWLDAMGDADGRRCRKTEWVGRLCCTETREANSRQQASARDVAGWEAGAPLPPPHWTSSKDAPHCHIPNSPQFLVPVPRRTALRLHPSTPQQPSTISPRYDICFSPGLFSLSR
ncbi:hypothetical protein NEUTE2DRAFT_128851 [Neurospora tetrasperma FGSC 2509]|nr:hypothetical protein NEUTE2DRAFT_128851 [Neurospora tetrasperma FGSC 2509]